MSASYNLESQNNDSLDSLSQKISALRGVTVDIYDQARNHDLIEQNQDAFGSLGQNIRGSAGRLTRMAQSGNKVAICKLAAIIVGIMVVLWWMLGFFLGGGGKS